MMKFTNFKKPRGTRDIINQEAFTRRTLIIKIEDILENRGYNLIITPTYENEQVFIKNLGEYSDIVNKEIFDLKDRKGRSLCLRPENTASVVRAVIENKMISENQTIKLFYSANMFRYERPQAGRYREFYQIGVELINAGGFISDCEILMTTKEILDELNLGELEFRVNYLVGTDSRKKFELELRKYITNNFLNKLCNLCLKRLDKNIWRILDCKECKINNIPKYYVFFNEEEQRYIKDLEIFLTNNNFKFSFDFKLFRGLDYYTGMVFEVILKNGEKSIIGGGRYDNLFESFGFKKKVPSLGFAIGIDRIILNKEKKKYDLILIWETEQSYSYIVEIKNNLVRKFGSKISINYNVTNKKREKKDLLLIHSSLKIIIGDEEIKKEAFFLYNNLENNKKEIKLNNIKKIEKEVKKIMDNKS